MNANGHTWYRKQTSSFTDLNSFLKTSSYTDMIALNWNPITIALCILILLFLMPYEKNQYWNKYFFVNLSHFIYSANQQNKINNICNSYTQFNNRYLLLLKKKMYTNVGEMKMHQLYAKSLFCLIKEEILIMVFHWTPMTPFNTFHGQNLKAIFFFVAFKDCKMVSLTTDCPVVNEHLCSFIFQKRIILCVKKSHLM